MDNLIFTNKLPSLSTGYYDNFTPDAFFNILNEEDRKYMTKLYKPELNYSMTVWLKEGESKIPIGHSKASNYFDLLKSFEDKLVELPIEMKNNFWFKTTYYCSYIYFKSFIEKNNIDINDVFHNSGLFIVPRFRKQGIATKLIQKRSSYFSNKVMLCFTVSSNAHKVFQNCGWINIAYVDYNRLFNHFRLENNLCQDKINLLSNDRLNLWIYVGDNIKNKYNLGDLTDLTDIIINFNLV